MAKAVKNIAALIERGRQKADEQAQGAIVRLWERAEQDPEVREVLQDAASRVKEGRVDLMEDREDSDLLLQEAEEELEGGRGEGKVLTDREAKLVRALSKAYEKIRELQGGEGLREREARPQEARVPQGQRSPQASAPQGRAPGPSQAGGRQGSRPQAVPQGNRPNPRGQQASQPQAPAQGQKARFPA